MPWLKLFPLLLTLLSFLQPLAANASTLLLPLAAAESADVSAAHRDAVSFCRSTAKDSAAHSDAPGASAFAVVDGTATAVYSFYAAMPSAAAILRNAEASGQGVITAIRRAGLAGEEVGAGQIGSRFGPSTAGAAQRLLGNVVQSGGQTINKATANALNKATGSSLQPRQWGRGLESLKKDLNLPNNHHGKITEYGYYLDDAGTELGNILDYL